MKRMISLLLVLAMCAALVSCGDSKKPADSSNNSSGAVSSESTNTEPENEPEEQDNIPTEVTEENLLSFPETDASYFDYDEVDGGVEITGCSAEDMVIVVPEQIDGKKVVSVGEAAFYAHSASGIVIPDCVEKIGRSAFFGCENLMCISLGEGITLIDDMSFAGCQKLKNVKLPDSLITIVARPFQECENLESVYVSENTTDIPYGIVNNMTCPNAVVVTPAGSAAEAVATEEGTPVRNS